jgi:hypothetical protein
MSTSTSLRLFALLLTINGLLPGSTNAVALYSGSASLNLTLTAVNGLDTIPAGLNLGYSAAVADQYALAQGLATATAVVNSLNPGEFVIDMPIGGTLIQQHAVAGQASNGGADSRLLTYGLILVDNQSTAPVTVSFSYQLVATVQAIADVTDSSAHAEMIWFLSDTDFLGQVNLSAGIFADGHSGLDADNLTISGGFDLRLDMGEFDLLTSALDTSGEAQAPEPPTWVMLAAGLILGLISHRYRA